MARFQKASVELVASLLNQLGGIEARLEKQERLITALQDQVRQLHQIMDAPLLDGQEEATAIERAVATLRGSLTEHEQRLDLLSRDRTAQRLAAGSTGGEPTERLTGGDYVAHQQIARDFDALVNQDLIFLATQMRWEGATEYDEVRTRAALAKMFFDESSVDRTVTQRLAQARKSFPALPQDAFVEADRRAARIRHAAAHTGHGVRWVFDSYSMVFDGTRQRLAEGCDRGMPVLFIVAPAYEVDGKIYAKQVVYTGSPQQQEAFQQALDQQAPDQQEAVRQEAVQQEPVRQEAVRQEAVQQGKSSPAGAFQQFGEEAEAEQEQYVVAYHHQAGQPGQTGYESWPGGRVTGQDANPVTPTAHYKHEPGSPEVFDIEAVDRQAQSQAQAQAQAHSNPDAEPPPGAMWPNQGV